MPTYSADLLRSFETLPGRYLILSPELYILTASNSYCKVVSTSRESIVGRYIFDVFPIRDEPEEVRVDYSLKQVLETRKPHYLPIIRFDGNGVNENARGRYWQSSNHPVFNDDGSIYYLIHQVEEVSEQIIAEQNLKEGLKNQTELAAKSAQLSKRLEKLISEIPARMATLSGPNLVYEYINSRYSKLFTGRNLLGKPLLEALPELKGHPLIVQLKAVYETGITYEGHEVCVPLANEIDGPLVNTYFNLVYQARYDEHGEINGILSFAYNITELVNARKILEENQLQLLSLNEEIQSVNEELNSANEELVESNAKLLVTQATLENLNRTLDDKVKLRTAELSLAQQHSDKQRDRLAQFFMQAPAGICIFDGPDFVFELVNPHYQELFPGRELIGKKLLEALPELAYTEIPKMIERVYKKGESFDRNEVLIPLSKTIDGPIEDRYFNFIYQTRHNMEGETDGVMVFAFEVTEVVVNRIKERERENRFKFLLNAIPQQVWTARPDGELDYVNEVVSNDFGKSIHEIVGSGWQAFIHPDDLQHCLVRWMDALRNGTEYMVEFRLLFANGTYKWHLARALPLIEHGQITLWLGTNTNIEFQKTNEKRKDEFLSIASHELKTPLTSIKAFNQLMVRAQHISDIQPHLKKSSDNIVRLEKLIDDLLDVTKITAGKMQYNMEKFNFDNMVTDVVEGFKLIALQHEVILENNDPILFRGDRFRLEQVLNNFLSNAVKYSPSGKKIIINCCNEQDNIVLSVQDFGIGIPKQDVNRLFERYYRVDNSSMRFEGLGLGLFIASEILKRHKGNFWLESEEGVGSTFYFRLPIYNQNLTPVKERDESYQDESIVINYSKEHNRLELDWIGHQNMETVKHGCLKTLEMILRFKVTKILNNNSRVIGSWSDASEWVGTVFFPMMEKKGIHSVAWIYSPNAFSQLSAKKSVDVAVGKITTQFFSSLEEAEDWINKR
ncbi:PAS domain-containing protein [Pedobacter sp. Du54]|uniref:PAS domain-containing protein n=1 Tax=Pedobacter anseongensis TaxID=3133439 RepID=UPI0030A9BF15